jgi:hypothetical protein
MMVAAGVTGAPPPPDPPPQPQAVPIRRARPIVPVLPRVWIIRVLPPDRTLMLRFVGDNALVRRAPRSDLIEHAHRPAISSPILRDGRHKKLVYLPNMKVL